MLLENFGFSLAPFRPAAHGNEAAEQAHALKVSRIATQLRQRNSTRPLSFRKRAVSHQVPKARDPKYTDERLDISDLDAILSIDPENRICVAEAGVTFVDLVAATLKHGLVPIVVPELKTITIGGAVAGCSIESTSFRHGGFHDTCLEYEVITARGDVITCTPTNEHRLTFQMMHGTFGTLGILSKLTFRLMPALPFVRVDYLRFATLGEFKAAIRRHREDGSVDFMDGMIHSPSEYVLCVGRFVAQAPYTSRYDWMKVYYESTRTLDRDFLRTTDYFFRYDRGVTRVHPRSKVGRFFLGMFIGSTELLRLAEKLNAFLPSKRPPVTVDVFLPFSRVDDFLRWHQREMDFYPLWVVPYTRRRDYEWLSEEFIKRCPDTLFLDVAIYGMEQRGDRNAYKMIEDKLLELGGVKTLISHNYYSEEDFWRTWNKENYRKAKALTDPTNVFGDLYTKTCRPPADARA